MRWSLLEQREHSGGARNKLQVKNCNDGEFAGVLITGGEKHEFSFKILGDLAE